MVRFFNKDIKFNLKHKLLLKKWIKSVVSNYGKRVGDINIILCDDPSILEINMQFLSHDYYTDIITFDYCEWDVLNGDIFISLDTVASNAEEFGVTFDEELHRVLIHGILHLCGQDDQTPELRAEMIAKENDALGML